MLVLGLAIFLNEACNNDCYWFRDLPDNWPVWETHRSSSYTLDFWPVHAEFLGKYVLSTDFAEMFRMLGLFSFYEQLVERYCVMAECLRRWIWNSGNVTARVQISPNAIFFLSFFLFFFLHILFWSTVFRMHTYFGTVSSLD